MDAKTKNVHITKKKEDLNEEEFAKVEKLERRLRRAISAIKRDRSCLAKKWKIIIKCMEDIREIMGENYSMPF